MSLRVKMQRSELVSTRNGRLLIMSVMKRGRVVVMQTRAPVDVHCYLVGSGLSTLLCPASVAAMVPVEGGCSIISGGDLLPERRFLYLEL
jgi:hypothetical protein